MPICVGSPVRASRICSGAWLTCTCIFEVTIELERMSTIGCASPDAAAKVNPAIKADSLEIAML